MPSTEDIGSGAPFWGDSPEVWDEVELGGVRIPGVCRVSGDGMRLRKDTKKAAGASGATVAFLGLDVVSFSIDVRMWKREHLTAFEEIVGMARPKSRFSGDSTAVSLTTGRKISGPKVIGYDTVPLTVLHPALSIFGISECVVESVSIPSEQSPGLWVASIRCTEFRKPVDSGVSKGEGGKKKGEGVDYTTDVIGAISSQSPSEANSGPNVQ